MTRLVDKSRQTVEDLVNEEAITVASKFAYSEMNETIKLKLKTPPPSGNAVWDPIIAAQFLNSCRELVEEDLKKDAAGYSAIRWLWMLRRIPRRIFAGRLATTYGYDAALAEIISGNWGAADSSNIRKRELAYKLDEHVIRRVLRFCEKVRCLSHIHTLIRKAGKGFEFSFAAGAIPRDRANADLEKAIRFYDDRVAIEGIGLQGRLGTVASSLDLNADASRSILLVNLVPEPSWLPTLFGSLMSGHLDVEVYANHALGLVSLESLATLNADHRLLGIQWWPSEVGPLLLLLRLAISLLPHADGAFCTVPQYGYFLVEEEFFKLIVNERIADASKMVRDIAPNVRLPAKADDLLTALEGISGSVWPLRNGSPIRRSGNLLCVDLYTASALLDKSVGFPIGTGDPANARAEHFELAVQKIIDSSPWCPPQRLRDYRGRKLRHGTTDITDIDAIGANGVTIVIVSCKSKIYSPAHDIGDYATIRNARTDIEEAVARWHKIRNFLEANPVGSNYDLSDYQQFIAVVCTPYPVYVHLGLATQPLSTGLPAASSISELKKWLMK